MQAIQSVSVLIACPIELRLPRSAKADESYSLRQPIGYAPAHREQRARASAAAELVLKVYYRRVRCGCGFRRCANRLAHRACLRSDGRTAAARAASVEIRSELYSATSRSSVTAMPGSGPRTRRAPTVLNRTANDPEASGRLFQRPVRLVATDDPEDCPGFQGMICKIDFPGLIFSERADRVRCVEQIHTGPATSLVAKCPPDATTSAVAVQIDAR